jgi:bifunctional non-homologous end joining protein LigD
MPDRLTEREAPAPTHRIGGHTAPRGSRSGFGSLPLGVNDDTGTLRDCGNVGTGAAAIAALREPWTCTSPTLIA